MTRLLVFLIFLLAAAGAGNAQYLTAADVMNRPATPPPDERVAYGRDPLQFGELRLPAGPGPHPVAVVIHGGCWQARYDARYIGDFVAALTGAGVATWSLEYRRIGNEGGGWPGTFEDIGRGTDLLRSLMSPRRERAAIRSSSSWPTSRPTSS